jgi:nucleotide-binding universal stress UspA family protein
MIKKILVCLDGSALAEEILPLVEEQAACFKASLILLQAIRSPAQVVPATALEAGMLIPPTESEINLNLRQAQEMQAEALAYLEKTAKELRARGVSVDCTVIEGKPGQVILDYAGQNCVDLIALASHGRSGLGRAVYGSVAEHVLKNSGLPMLIIRPRTLS